MQRACRPILIVLSAGVLVTGCKRAAEPAVAAPPQSAVTLTLACADPATAKELLGRAAGWAATAGGVRVELAAGGDADVAVVRPSELGRLAAAGRAAPLPGEYKAAGHPLQWPRVLPAYRVVLGGWAGDTVALPLAGDSLLVAYRDDRFDDPKHKTGFQARFGRGLQPPATWDDLLDAADYFTAADGKPALPGVPADPGRLLAEFHAAAACFDRRALVDADLKGKEPPAGGFHFDPATGKPRLDAPGFRAAADWLAKAAPLRSPEADPAAALTAGTAAVALVTLADLGRLPRGPDGVADRRVRVLPPPGSRTYFGDKGSPQRAGGRAGNYVPFLGAGGWVGVVDPARPHAARAWELLAELAGPAATAARLSDPALGAGPVRADAGGGGAWARYAFDKDRNAELAAAVRQFLAVEVVNPAVTLRTPDAADKLAALADAVRQAAAGKLTGEAAMKQAAEAWAKQDAAADPAALKRQRRNAAGLP